MYPLQKKLEYLLSIRHEIKKKRFLLDESKEKFGMDEMTQLARVKNENEVKGYPFKVSKSDSPTTKGLKLGLKVVPIETKYEKNEHPCNLENVVLKTLTDQIVKTGISPHITYYLATQKVSNKSRALKFLNLKRLEVEGKIRTHSNMLISEYVEGGSLDNWVFTTYEDDKEISDEQWKSIVFQLVYTIAVIQHYYKMMHNDFHYGNILIDNSTEPGGYFVYTIKDKTFYIKNTGIIPKLWDFEFSMVYSDKIPECYPNKFITGDHKYDYQQHKAIVATEDADEEFNVPFHYNEVYDLHYFLTSLLDLYISQDLFDWIMTLYPEELIPEEETSSPSSKFSDSMARSNATQQSDSEDCEGNDTEGSDTEASETEGSDTESWETDDETNSFLCDGRMINGVEARFKDLPTPLSLLNNGFFKGFEEKPSDFDEKTAIYFKAGF